jgi:hypothetical protein
MVAALLHLSLFTEPIRDGSLRFLEAALVLFSLKLQFRRGT